MRRTLVQLTSSVLHNSYFQTIASANTYQGFLKGICPPTLNCYACPFAVVSCPIGALQHFAVIRMFPYYLAGALGLFGLASGKLACGWLCPFGLVQDLLAKVSRLKLRLPGILSFGPFVTLGLLAVAVPYATGQPWFSKLCPAGTLQAALPWVLYAPKKYTETVGMEPRKMIGTLFFVKVAILSLTFLAAVFVTRPFCRVFCPMGAILSLFNRISFVRLFVSEESCVRCRDTSSVCPVNINVRESPNHRDCYRCMECAKGCDHIRLGVAFPGAVPQGSKMPDVRLEAGES